MTIIASLPGPIVAHIRHLVPAAQRTHVVADAVQFEVAHGRRVLTLLAVAGQVQLEWDADRVVQLAGADAFGLEPFQVDHKDFRQSVQAALKFACGFALRTFVSIAWFGFKLIFE